MATGDLNIMTENASGRFTTPGAIATCFTFDGSGKLATVVADGTAGVQVGTATGQKLGFWGATPVVQQVLATGAGKTVDEVITVLQTLGLVKQS